MRNLFFRMKVQKLVFCGTNFCRLTVFARVYGINFCELTIFHGIYFALYLFSKASLNFVIDINVLLDILRNFRKKARNCVSKINFCELTIFV